MRKLQWVAFGLVIGFALAVTLGGLSIAGAQQNGPSPAEAQKLLAQEKAVLDQMVQQYTQMQQDMNTTMQMQMTPTEKAMMKQIQQLGTMVHMLWQSNTDLTNTLQMMMGSKNK